MGTLIREERCAAAHFPPFPILLPPLNPHNHHLNLSGHHLRPTHTLSQPPPRPSLSPLHSLPFSLHSGSLHSTHSLCSRPPPPPSTAAAIAPHSPFPSFTSSSPIHSLSSLSFGRTPAAAHLSGHRPRRRSSWPIPPPQFHFHP
ncbi:lysine-rich arabinogalactan protein 19-like [Arachis stenosperma]|uniref:lysine-rich arabinogalactan protein 19-like n=1 Tax=Arachis stenosperma TaxID=217475 RepID=UPI0025AD3A99|nr:lysine-rich arabinogalactan protein 19-like [Arachis stenosperma]